MANGFGSGSLNKKNNVKQFFLKKKLVEAKKYYFLKDYSKAESLFLYLKNSKYDD